MLESFYPNLNAAHELSDIVGHISAINMKNPLWLSTSLCAKNPAILNHTAYFCGQLKPRPVNKFKLVFIFLKRIYRNFMLAPRKIRKRITKRTLMCQPENVFFSLLNIKSFDHHGYHASFHWGSLVGESAQKKSTMVVGYMITDEHLVVKAIYKNNAGSGILVCPLEHFMDMPSSLKALVITLFSRVKLPSLAWRGKDVTSKVRTLINSERFNGEIFNNLCMYYAFRKMLKTLQGCKIYYPWENHSWEKLLLLAAGPYRPTLKLFGFQHASIPLMYINHFPGKEELSNMYYPDKIFTTGIVTRDILRHYGTFPDDCLTVASGLRHEYLHLLPTKKEVIPGNKLTIGIAPPTEFNETVAVIKSALPLSGKHRLLVRLYPLMRESQLALALGNIADTVEFSDQEIGTFLREIDILIYTNTTVGIESVSIGTPTIYFDTGFGALADPMFGNSALKWQASNTEELMERISEIASLPLEELKSQRKQAREYVKAYFIPMDHERIEILLDT